MAPANRLIMARGDTLVIHPGEHAVSLALMGEGSKQAPVTIRFMPGRHIFKHGALMTGKPQISNTNDAPNEPKAMAIRLMEAKTYAWRESREPPTSCWKEKPSLSAWNMRKTFP